jgi:hypothetical protein
MGLTILSKCGKCTACCTLMPVKELRKPERTACAHQRTTGCSIYKKRPDECQKFKCHWLATAHTRPQYRPDQLGVMVVLFKLAKPYNWGYKVVEVTPGAYEKSIPGLRRWAQRSKWPRGGLVHAEIDGRLRLIGGRKKLVEWYNLNPDPEVDVDPQHLCLVME